MTTPTTRLFILCMIYSLAVLGAIATPVMAKEDDTPPAPISRQQSLDQIKSEIKAREREQNALKKESEKIEGAIEGLQKNLVSIAAKIKGTEQDLIQLEQDEKSLKATQKDLEVDITRSRANFAELVLGLQRLKNIPTEALLARPGAPIEHAQTALILNNTIPALNENARILQEKLTKLESVKNALLEKRQKIEGRLEQLSTQNNEMSKQIAERQSLLQKTAQSRFAQARQLQDLSANAKNLEDLIGRIEEERQRQNAPKPPPAKSNLSIATSHRSVERAASIPPSGEGIMPLSGIIRTHFGGNDSLGSKSEGVHIEGRNHALVVSPMGGLVRFAGPFRRLGRIVLIEHDKDYHSLLAGLDEINVQVGQTLSAGEPIGKLGQSSDGRKQTLYYELRHKGKPVNPSRRISALSLQDGS